MITDIAISHFRCFENIAISDCRRINVLVGDNGSGKTALLEALFLTLSSGIEPSVRLRNMRGGLPPSFSGVPRDIEEAIWRDYFYQMDWSHDIFVRLVGRGAVARSLRIQRGPGTIEMPLISGTEAASRNGSLSFTWTNASGAIFTATAEVNNQGPLRLPGTSEDLPDFFFLPAGPQLSPVEVATHFSALRRAGRDKAFISSLRAEYPWIEDLSIEVAGGAPQIFARVKSLDQPISLASISGGINRSVGLMLHIAARDGAVVLIDEIEGGLYHIHQTGLWRSVLGFAREYDCQLFVTTHSEEWLEALVAAAGDALDDIALWRLERGDRGPVVRQFSGVDLRAGLETGGELR